MSNKFTLISGIVQFVFGIMGIISAIVLFIDDALEPRFYVATGLSIFFTIIGLIEIVDYIKMKHKK